MAEVDVTLVERNSQSRTIRRPLHRAGNSYAVTFQRQKWPIGKGLCLDLRTAKPLGENVQTRPATSREAAELTGSTKAPEKSTEGSANGEKVAEKPTPLLVVIPAMDPAGDEFDDSQKKVIREKAPVRQLVDAGPGVGKTAVACARVAWLVGQEGIPPAQVWVISFTRTAVEEIRTRVARQLDRGIANAIQMATLDSMAWQINAGFNPEASLTGTFDDNIRALHGELDENRQVGEYLSDLRHLVIDEAQDIVGPRADLLIALIEKLPAECGVTIFSDEAQAIYGFAAMDAAEDHGGENPQPCLPKRIRQSPLGKSFLDRTLDQVHRTSDSKLKTIFTTVRLEVLDPAQGALKRNEHVRKRLKDLAHAEASKDIEEAARGLPDDAFILFRRRIEASRASGALRRAGIRHRLRMSNLPVTIAPWIAASLGQAQEPRVGEKTFRKLWSEHVESTPLATVPVDAAYALLKEFAPDQGGRLIDLTLLRNKLASKPPSSVARAELGSGGPILGTIHASKGREAASVTLMMPALPNGKEKELAIDEETRVLFVAATRARQQLRIADAYPVRSARTVDSNRDYRFDLWNKSAKCDFEVGRTGDIRPSGIAGREFFSGPDQVLSNRSAWIALAAEEAEVCAIKRKIGDQWRFCVSKEYGDPLLAILNNSIDDDLWEAASRGAKHFKLKGNAKKPAKLFPLYTTGVTTMALRSDDPEREALLEPWRSTGLLVVPLIYGLARFSIRTREA